MQLPRTIGLLLGACLFSGASWALSFEQTTLSNGIRVVVVPDTSSNVAALEVIYRVGGFAEHRPVSGISHMLEHMMFQGTEQNPQSSFTEALQKAGGLVNAFTTEDYTGYHELVPAEELPALMALEADRAQNLSLNEADFLKEIEVVKEERRMRVEDVPVMRLFERLEAAAFPSGPYHDPLVGWMDDLNNMTIQQVRHWYEQWYCAGNISVVVVGNVQPAAVFDLAERTFGRVRECRHPTPRVLQEVPQLGPIELEATLSTAVPILELGYRVPTVATAEKAWEPYALLVAMDILDGGQSARFEKHIVREDQVASSIWGRYEPDGRFETLLLFGGTAMPDVSIAQLERAILKQIKTLQTTLVAEEELELAKMRLKAEQAYVQDNPLSRLHWLASYEGLGLSVEMALERLEKIEAVTPEQVQAVMKKYLQPTSVIKAVGLPSVGEEQNA